MGKYLRTARRKVAAGAIGAALLLTGVGIGAHSALSAPGTRTTSDSTEVTTPAAPSSSASPTASPSSSPDGTSAAATPTPDTAAATVAAVDTTPPTAAGDDPAPQPAPDPANASSSYDPTAPFTDGEGHTYAPMPPLPVSKVPGDPGYTPPVG